MTGLPGSRKLLMTTEEVARWLGVRPVTVRKYVKEGSLRAIRPGGHLRFYRAEIEALAEMLTEGVK